MKRKDTKDIVSRSDFSRPAPDAWHDFLYIAVGTAVLFPILAYIARFSFRQSVVLALFLALVARSLNQIYEEFWQFANKVVEKPAWKFWPYTVRIDPKWEQLLTDFKLIGASDDWEEFRTAVSEALPYGVKFTLLQQDDDFQKGVIFRGPFFSTNKNGEREIAPTFYDLVGSGALIREVIAPIRFENPEDQLELFVKSGEHGYDLGIIVPTRWWDRVKASCPKPINIREGTSSEWYSAFLTLATIPYAEFDSYREPRSYQDHEEWSHRVMSQRDEQRVNFGWKKEEVGLMHRYFEVRHGSIGSNGWLV